MGKVIKSPVIWLLGVALLFIILTGATMGGFRGIPGDTPSYIKAANFVSGVDVGPQVPLNRLLTTPLMIYASVVLGYLFGSALNGFLALNFLFYFLLILVFYNLVNLVYKDKTVSFLSVILLASNYILLSFGLTYLADLGGWFFMVLGTYFAVRYYQGNNEKYLYLTAVTASVGCLFKETGGLGIISLGILVLLSRLDLRDKVVKIFKAGSVFILLPLLWHLVIYFKYDFTYFDWYAFAGETYGSDGRGIKNLVSVLGWLFLPGWPLFALGLYYEYRDVVGARMRILIALLPASLMFLIWPVFDQRIAFIIMPWLVLIAGYGLSKIRNRFVVVAVIMLYILINLNINELTNMINIF